MQYRQAVDLLNETGLSPEGIAERLSISNSTYRRWLKVPAHNTLPDAYRINVSCGVHKLLSEGLLNHNSPRVVEFLKTHLPDFFQAIIAGFHIPPDLFAGKASHQDKITALLSHLGNSGSIRQEVDTAIPQMRKFEQWGGEWKSRIRSLCQVIKAKRITLVDKLVAYGALFYLVLPMDLIPDPIIPFGYVDDFGILGYALAFYHKFPGLRFK